MNFRKLLRLRHLFLASIAMFFAGCSGAEETDKTPLLSFAESSIPTDNLLADGGSVMLEVTWAHTQWNVSTGNVLQGNAFITEIGPSYAGSAGQGKTTTKVKITYKSNKAAAPNRQELILKSLTENMSQTITVTQAGIAVSPVNATVDTQTKYQKITGFGGGNTMWGTSYLTPTQIKTVFGQGDDELGFSMFRVRLSSVQSEWADVVTTVQEAKKYGVTILATPWSPPANLKSNSNVIGGSLLESNYGAYATYLNNFVQYMAGQSVTIDAVSIQNEPDISVSYESCDWSSTQIYNFVKNNGATVQGAKLVAAESFNFKQSYTDAILNDPSAVDNLDVVAGHLYGGGLASYPVAEQKGKEIWMTEYLLNLNSGNVQNAWVNATEAAKWTETLTMLGTVHKAMTSNWNAYIWWYIRRYYSFIGDGEQGTVLGQILKRGYAISHYAKFVRPGYYRVATTQDTNAALNMTAYNGDNKVVVVLTNNESYDFPEVNLSIPSTITSTESYTTSLLTDRQKQVLTAAQNKVKVIVPALSIVTVVMNY